MTLLAVALVAAGCSDGDDDDSTLEQLDGGWRLTAATIDGEPDDEMELIIELEIVDAILRGETVCHTIFGSFTFAADGAASLTVPGRSTTPCDEPLQAIEDRTIAALESISQWEQAEDRLLLDQPNQVTLEFRRVG